MFANPVVNPIIKIFLIKNNGIFVHRKVFPSQVILEFCKETFPFRLITAGELK